MPKLKRPLEQEHAHTNNLPAPTLNKVDQIRFILNSGDKVIINAVEKGVLTTAEAYTQIRNEKRNAVTAPAHKFNPKEIDQKWTKEFENKWQAFAAKHKKAKPGPTRPRILEMLRHMETRKQYWPLTGRQVFYQLVTEAGLENNRLTSRMVGRDIKKGCEAELIPWEAVEDRTRRLREPNVYLNKEVFLDSVLDDLTNYKRDFAQNQNQAIEVWIEKDALVHIVQPVAFKYCVPLASARGFASVAYLKELCDRIDERWEKEGRGTLVLYFGDLDDHGFAMRYIMENTVRVRIGIKAFGAFEIKYCGLLPKHVKPFALQPNVMPAKGEEKKGFQTFKDTMGKIIGDGKKYELDALHPGDLQTVVKETIEAHMDNKKFEDEKAKNKVDKEWLNKIEGEIREEYLPGKEDEDE